MTEAPLLLVVVVMSYLAAHVIFERLARRFQLVSGAEYLLLGLLLGPEVGRVLPGSATENFSPLITLGLGWIGALAGTQLALPRLVRTPAVRYRVAVAEALGTGTFMGAVAFALLRWGAGVPLYESSIIAAALALVALPASAAGVSVVARAQATRAPVVRQLEVTTSLHGVLASAGLAVLFALLHATPTTLARPVVPTEWVAITIAIGVVGGTLFHIFVGDETKVDRLFISLAGAIILVSGAAAALRLSPVFAALVFGTILGNTPGNRAEVVAALSRVERPFYFALLIFAGASWRAPATRWLPVIAAVVVLRPLARLAAARLAARLNGMLPELGAHWGRGLIGHGGFALVLALDYYRQARMPGADLLFTAVIASLLLTDVVSARIVQSLVRLPHLLGGDAPTDAPVPDAPDGGRGSEAGT